MCLFTFDQVCIIIRNIERILIPRENENTNSAVISEDCKTIKPLYSFPSTSEPDIRKIWDIFTLKFALFYTIIK